MPYPHEPASRHAARSCNEVLAALGAGGMGEVYKARDSRLDRPVAVKILSPVMAVSSDARERFEREARAISRLSHPHVCTLFDVGRDGDTLYLVMELLEGETPRATSPRARSRRPRFSESADRSPRRWRRRLERVSRIETSSPPT